MSRLRVLVLPCLAFALVALPSGASAAAPAKWLCSPTMKKDPCRPGLATTAFSPTGTKTGTSTPKAAKHPKLDCFYVYPTVSDQPTRLATKKIDPEVRSIALYQAARYSQLCRVFAPVYRQVTIAGLSGRTEGNINSYASYNPKGYADVRDAWREYLRKENKGRGVVLIGHSQGTYLLRALIPREIDAKAAVRRNVVSAILLGGNVTVPVGKDVGGDFKHLPACRAATQTGCIIAFSTFDETPPANALFGRTSLAGREVLCTNPAALGGGSGALTPIFPSKPFAPGTLIAAGIGLLGVKQPTAATPWVSSPRSYSGECATEENASFLRIAPLDGAQDFKPSPTPEWGLHLTDANIALGNLVDVVQAQGKAFAKR
jgi:hypothetical protein